jgi:hypothetical protein
MDSIQIQIKLDQDTTQWRALAKTIIIHEVLQNVGKF